MSKRPTIIIIRIQRNKNCTHISNVLLYKIPLACVEKNKLNVFFS